MSVKTRIAELNGRLAEKLTAKGVEAGGNETTTALIDKVDSIEQGGENPLEYARSIWGAYESVTFPAGYDLVIDMPHIGGIGANASFDQAFRNTKGLRKVTIRTSRTDVKVSFVYAWLNSVALEIVDLSDFLCKIGGAVGFFNGCSKLHTILGVLDFSELTVENTTYFTGCSSLVYVRFAKSSIKYNLSFPQSTLLSAESIQSIIDGLADLTGATAKTITFHSDVVLNLSDEQLQTILAKNWQVG